jgi:hypothetical protein
MDWKNEPVVMQRRGTCNRLRRLADERSSDDHGQRKRPDCAEFGSLCQYE